MRALGHGSEGCGRAAGVRLRLVMVALLAFFGCLLSASVGAAAEPAGGTGGVSQAQEPEHPEDQAGEEHAAAEGEHGAEEHHGPTWSEVGFRWINFALLLGLLWWLLVVPPAFVIENFDFPGLKVVLASRGQDILRSRDLAQEQAEDAERRLQESRQRLEQVEEEVVGLIVAAEDDAEQERQRLVEDAREEAERIRSHTERDLGAELVRAKRGLKRHVADLSVGMAAEILQENLSSEDQERLVRQYLDGLGETVG